ncbi:hypothetical protein [Haloplanus salinarum]|uniref:hypothetical protein n=1 Tax=Haloplanus salinarum TaxID=1912324 RepID=UPI00214B119D|nr:hypothetical protein [Haloplanus salinarum]
MRRRAFLASAGIAALAGCSNGDGPNDTTPTGTETGTETGTGSGSAEFEFLGVEAADQISINVPTTFGFGVRNVGSAEGTFTATLETRRAGEEWTQASEIEMSLAAGETGEWHSPRFALNYLDTYEFRLPAVDETWSIETMPRRLDFGNYYAVPTGLYINVLGGSFEAEYPTSDETTNATATPTNGTATPEPTPTNGTATPEPTPTNGTATPEPTPTNGTATPEPTPTPSTPSPDEGDIWAVMRIDVRNRLQEPQSTPDPSEFVLEIEGERRPQHQEVSDDPYDGGELAARTVERGDLVYAVPEGTRARDVTLWWESSLPGGDVRSIWTK